jgi:Asp-tRNA(Asn)/Glu-tRNA(Gln) amidotransferase A subunit family amidase
VAANSTVDLSRLPARLAAEAIRRGELSSVELVEACLARIAARESAVGAWAYLDRDAALRQAREADAEPRSGRALGPLHGLPIGIKDVFDTTGMPTEYGSSSLRGRCPEVDADAVAVLRAAGAVIIGKTVTSEFGMYAVTSCRNPHDDARSAGVSSAGSAAAAADFMVPLALGTQHTASTLLPASFCGTFGYKPTSGFTSMRGSNILVPRLANIGLLARSVDDLALFASAFRREFSMTPPPSRQPRLGLVRGPAWSRVAPDAVEAFDVFCRKLAIPTEEIALSAEFEDVENVTRGLLAAHLSHRFAAVPAPVEAGYCAPLRELIAAGAKLDAACYIAFDNAADRIGEASDRLFADVDALITLSALGEATPASEPGSGALCMPWSLAGLPVISLPLLRGAHGLPIGIQLVGTRGGDAMLLSIAAWLVNAAEPACMVP